MNKLWRIEDGKVVITPHKGQQEVLQATERFVAMICGTGGGKTSLIPIWLFQELSKDWDRGDFTSEYMVVSPTFKMQQRFALPAVRDFFDVVVHGTYKAMENVYLLPTGNKIWFGSADNPFSLEGVHLNGLCLDEAGQMNGAVWEVAQRRVGFKQGRILITTTPYSNNWLKLQVYDKWLQGLPEYKVVQFSSIENPAYPRKEFERAKRDMPEWQFRMFYLGEFAKPENLVYSDFSNDNIVEPFDIQPSWRHFAGVDWGYTNPTAVVFCAQEPTSGIIYVYNEYFHDHKLYEESAMEVEKMLGDTRMEYFACDPSEPSAIQVWKQKGLPAHPAANDVLAGINEVARLIKNKQLRIFRTCYNTIDEMNGYMWNAEREVPVKENDHLVDALRYAIMGLKSSRPNMRII